MRMRLLCQRVCYKLSFGQLSKFLHVCISSCQPSDHRWLGDGKPKAPYRKLSPAIPRDQEVLYRPRLHWAKAKPTSQPVVQRNIEIFNIKSMPKITVYVIFMYTIIAETNRTLPQQVKFYADQINKDNSCFIVQLPAWALYVY